MPDRRSDANRRHLRAGAILAAAVAASSAASLLEAQPARAQEEAPPKTSPRAESGFEELDAETRAAIDKGAEWLANAQEASGRWGCDPVNWQMSITALSGLALLAHGDTPDTGRYSRQVRRAIEWILRSQVEKEQVQPARPDGLLAIYEGAFFDRGVVDPDDKVMHGHGFALLFLGEAYGQMADPRLRERTHRAIARGVRLTERTISGDGGWFYKPEDFRDEGSVTVTQIQGLRSARNAGIAVDGKVVERAVEYIKKSQRPDGGVQYMLRNGQTSPALTAAGMEVLFGAGVYQGEAIEKGFAYLRRNLKYDDDDPSNKWFHYTHLYASQAMFQRGGPEWESYFPRIRRELLNLKKGDAWESPYGRNYGTANALLILELPLRYLPIYQR